MAEDMRNVAIPTGTEDKKDGNSTISRVRETRSEVNFDDVEAELRGLFLPEALTKLFNTDGPSASAVENARADDGAVTTADEHGLHVVAGIMHQTFTDLEKWLYETSAGRELQKTILQEAPDLKEPLEVGLRNLFHLLLSILGQLKDKTHPHFQEIERWYSTYHLLVKATVNFLHGGVVRLMKSKVSKRNNSFDVSRIIRQVLNIRQINEYFTRLPSFCQTQQGLNLLRFTYIQIPEQLRPTEREFFKLPIVFQTVFQQLKEPSNPIVKTIEQWFADADVHLQIAVDVLHGAVLGLINNEACKGFGPLNVTELFKEVLKAVQMFQTSWHHWLFETQSGKEIVKVIALEWLAPVRPNDCKYRNGLNIVGINIIQISRAAHLPFEPIERMLAEDKELLSLLVKAFHSVLVWSINAGRGIDLMYIHVLHILNEINEKNGYPVPRRLFWLQGLESSHHLRPSLLQYTANQDKTKPQSKTQTFSWLDVPFLLNVRTKWKFVSLEAVLTMERDMIKADKENSIRRQVNKTIYAKWFPKAQKPIIPTCLQFHVDRDNIVQSAIYNVNKYWNDNEDSESNSVWLKPLEINFERESAIDLGGPSKDFFHHLFSALLDQDIMSMFRKLDDQATSSQVWFNPAYLDYSTLEKIGLLFALAIYNGAVTPVPFPEQLYEKLLTNKDPDAGDLEKMDQEFVTRLYMLRELGRGDMEALEFDFGDLRPGGENISVTKENVEAYIREMINKQLAIPQLTAFAKGFNRIASMTPLMKNIFKAEDLRDVILGEELDWNAFKLSAMYQFPYLPGHPVIKMFWKVFDELEEREKRQFLKFLTGADHVPVGGFVPFPIRRLNNMAEKYRDPVNHEKYPEPGQLMPEVMTCRGYLSMDLPEYKSEEDLRYRLKLAIQTSGFHRETTRGFSSTAPCSQTPMLRQVVHAGMQLLLGGNR